jgi:hypothetical protein
VQRTDRVVVLAFVEEKLRATVRVSLALQVLEM